VGVMLVLMVFPLVTTLWFSLHRLKIEDIKDGGATWIGFDNYRELLSDEQFWAALRFTLVFVAVTVPLHMIIGLGVSLLLDKVTKGRAIYMAALLLPFIVTPVVGTVIYKDLFERGGLLFWLYEVITDTPFAVTAGNVKWLIIIQSVWHVMPFSMITFFAGLQTLPASRIEAAAIDGASYWRNLWHVVLPHLRVLLLFVALISIMDAYRVYDSVFVFAGDRFTEAHTLQVYNVEQVLDPNIGRLGKGYAIAVLNIVGIFVVLIPFLYKSYKDQIAERL